MKKKNIIIILILIFLAIIFGATAFGYVWWGIFRPVSSETQEKIFIIEKGEGVKKIAASLKEEGLIKSQLSFEIYVDLSGRERKLKAGEHKLNTAMNIREIVKVLTVPQSRERTIQIIEGWRGEEIGGYLEKEGVVQKETFLEEISNFQFPISNYQFLEDKPEVASLEGYLFPDTYRIYKDAKAEDIIKKMLNNFNEKLTADLRQEIKKQDKTIFEVVTLASILEKEVASDQDRALAADIFWRRLEIGMPLQADATVNFVTGKKTTRASQADLVVDSPYNTYKYPGLPPGPICNPGLSAIGAAIFPQANDYWYFLTTEDGQVIYSKTAKEHIMNKAKYLR